MLRQLRIRSWSSVSVEGHHRDRPFLIHHCDRSGLGHHRGAQKVNRRLQSVEFGQSLLKGAEQDGESGVHFWDLRQPHLLADTAAQFRCWTRPNGKSTHQAYTFCKLLLKLLLFNGLVRIHKL